MSGAHRAEQAQRGAAPTARANLVVPTAEAMRILGARLALLVRPGDLAVLTGDLGAGKTTLTQGIGTGLGVREMISSPTFVIARVHPSLVGGADLVHVDAYRLGSLAEVDELDLDASLDRSVTVVEWGEGLVEGARGGEHPLHAQAGDAAGQGEGDTAGPPAPGGGGGREGAVEHRSLRGGHPGAQHAGRATVVVAVAVTGAGPDGDRREGPSGDAGCPLRHRGADVPPAGVGAARTVGEDAAVRARRAKPGRRLSQAARLERIRADQGLSARASRFSHEPL